MEGENRWLGRLEGVAGRSTTQLATMGMPNVRYVPEPNVSPNAKLMLFIEGVIGAMELFHSKGRPHWPMRPGGFAGVP